MTDPVLTKGRSKGFHTLENWPLPSGIYAWVLIWHDKEEK